MPATAVQTAVYREGRYLGEAEVVRSWREDRTAIPVAGSNQITWRQQQIGLPSQIKFLSVEPELEADLNQLISIRQSLESRRAGRGHRMPMIELDIDGRVVLAEVSGPAFDPWPSLRSEFDLNLIEPEG